MLGVVDEFDLLRGRHADAGEARALLDSIIREDLLARHRDFTLLQDHCTVRAGPATAGRRPLVVAVLDGRILSADADVLGYMGSDWGEEETDSKFRYYADIEAENIKRFPGDEVIESLPEELREAHQD